MVVKKCGFIHRREKKVTLIAVEAYLQTARIIHQLIDNP
jgi:hypothetical protein